jgi:transcriptional regulator GlxA family with amidase domain
LDERRCTTHWAFLDALAAQFPRAAVQRDVLYVEDEGVFTSAGVTSGIDLALSLVEADVGPEIALSVARRLVVFLHRSGGQSQFSAATSLAVPTASARLRSWVASVAERPSEDHRVSVAASRVGMSTRNFARVFRREFGVTPADCVTRIRLERARRQLELSDATVAAVADECGFGTAETLRRAFREQFGITPAEYRERFSR